MKTNRFEGLQEELSSLFSSHQPQTENYGRLVETGNHTSIPKCRNCKGKEDCLELGPKCANVRRTSITG